MASDKLLEALEFAAEFHKHQRRKANGGSPYINHLIEVASLLANVAKVSDKDVIIAGVLHDILEDTVALETEIMERFGENVFHYVKSVTDDKALPLEVRRQRQLQSIAGASREIRLIKLADHCSNIANLPSSWDMQRLEDYISWSHAVAGHCYSVSPALAKVYQDRYRKAMSKRGLSTEK